MSICHPFQIYWILIWNLSWIICSFVVKVVLYFLKFAPVCFGNQVSGLSKGEGRDNLQRHLPSDLWQYMDQFPPFKGAPDVQQWSGNHLSMAHPMYNSRVDITFIWTTRTKTIRTHLNTIEFGPLWKPTRTNLKKNTPKLGFQLASTQVFFYNWLNI